ncbi:Starch-binding associating with outer membrane [Pedobacter sp. ok626]|uniref:RagB/SusD family nutrient uptake outer membrane protein n=1 Tax=Pedobacter sp. ok626 TaxID=1761882 RepID=UPI00087F4435|nr:RagB/SusD family nutrient uptake outer membrane protein [Pedobacter sp. ok626]SDJ99840.1 Starch-binding associating with outer membrane [Pedobacter sp. ok626]
MKNRYLIIMLLVIITLASCKKFLDTSPSDFLSPKNYYETETQLNTGLTGVYVTLASQNLYCNNMLARMGLETDEGFCSNAAELVGVAGYNVSTTDAKVLGYWQALYAGINRANLVLENINKPKMDETRRGKIKGETLFLRAYFYFMLVSTFNDVPLVLKTPVTAASQDIQLPPTPAKDVYVQILKDMEEASLLVDDIKTVNFGGRVSKSAVWGVMARVCLYMAGNPVNDLTKYADAKKWAEKVMTEGTHSLNTSFQDVFVNYAQDKYDVKESIWEVEFWGNNSTAYTIGGMVGRNNGIRQNAGGDPSIGYSPGYLHPTLWMFNLYEPTGVTYSNDLRRDWSIAAFSYSGNNTNIKVNWATNQIYQRNCGKWRRENEIMLPKADIRTPQNFPLLRYSDVLLMYAEADNEINGPINETIAAVNTVRRRGYGKFLNGYGAVSESVKTITLDNGGSGYTSVPTVVIAGGEGSGATATATISGGKVSAITITNSGSKFKTIPTVTITGGGGTLARATATLTSITDADLKANNTASKDDFRTAIQNERARELNYELLRRGDLVRWGKFIERLTAIKTEVTASSSSVDRNNALICYSNFSERDVLWPIPSYEIGVNPNLIQNKGW